MKYRYESFGGIVASEDPPFLAFADRAFMRGIVAGESPLWKDGAEHLGLLSAPTEVHLSATNQCPNRCPHCYMDSGVADRGEMSTDTFKKALDCLAAMGVFHVALGGGEALARPDLFELASHARRIGLVPNLTISGALLTRETAAKMNLFGQVNLSLDAVGPDSAVFRGTDISSQVEAAARMLVESGVATGINCVLGRKNYPGIERLFAFARNNGLNELEFLRLKPVGRGRQVFRDERMTPEQNIDLCPRLQGLSENYSIRAKIDCSFIPMLCHHSPPLEVLESLGAYGCEAGNILVGARSDGTVSGCSFLPGTGLTLFDLSERWASDPVLGHFRHWRRRAPSPCNTCTYLNLCNGGCHAVSAFLTGDPDRPDPDCPSVAAKGQD